jgi:hypothetical protein
VLVCVRDLNATIVNAATGELLRQLTLDPTKDYQPTGPPAPPRAPNGKAPHLTQFGTIPMS